MSDSAPNRSPTGVVVVTGAAGRVGLATMRAIARDYRVVAFDRIAQRGPPHEVECVVVDLTNPESIDFGMRRLRYAYGNRIASVIHLAAYHDFSGEDSPLYDEVTVRGTARLLEALQDFEVEQFVFSSTMLVHRPTGPGNPVDEDSPLEAKWAYPRSKIETENLLREQRGGIPVVSLRIAGAYTDDCESVPLAMQIERILSKPVQGKVFPGDPSHGQALVHMDDVTDAIRRTIDRRHDLPRDDMLPILIGEPTTYSYETVQKELARLLLGEADWPAREIPAQLAKAVAWVQDRLPLVEPPVKPWMIERADDHYELDVSRAEELLGWRPRHDLLETLPRMIESFARDPDRWMALNDVDISDSRVKEVTERR